jgi:hypothetical protein
MTSTLFAPLHQQDSKFQMANFHWHWTISTYNHIVNNVFYNVLTTEWSKKPKEELGFISMSWKTIFIIRENCKFKPLGQLVKFLFLQ